MIRFKHKGDLNKTKNSIRKMKDIEIVKILSTYGEKGVEALLIATPKDTGETSRSWKYFLEKTRNGWNIVWTNDNMSGGVSIAVLIQFGFMTRRGAYVSGRDYINPAMQPVFDSLVENMWEEVRRV